MSVHNRFLGIVIGTLVGAILQERTIGKRRSYELKNARNMNEKFSEFYDLLVQWVTLKQTNKSVSEYLASKNYNNIAIYGVKELGELLIKELHNTGIKVKYAIDQDADSIYLPIEIYKPNEKLQEVDAVIVTAIHYYGEIRNTLSDKLSCPILSLYDIVYDI